MYEMNRKHYTLDALLKNDEIREKLIGEFTNEVVGGAEDNRMPDIPTHTVLRDEIEMQRHEAKTVDVLLASGDTEMLVMAFDALARKQEEKIKANPDQAEKPLDQVAHEMIAASQKETHALDAALLEDYNAQHISLKQFVARQTRLTKAREMLDEAHKALCPEIKLPAESLSAEDRMFRHGISRSSGWSQGLSN